MVIVLLALFVVLDVGLFGWLIFRSLSQREINGIVLEARQEAEEVADQIKSAAERFDDDLMMAMATDAETRTYIDSVLAKREIVQIVQVFDRDHLLVWQSKSVEREGEAPEELDLDDQAEFPKIITERVVRSTPYDVVEVPVGDMGKIQIGLRREEVERRLEVLRGDLIQQAGVIGGLTVLLLVSAYWVIWRLLVRAQRLQDEVAESERMAYIGTLASGLAHEIRSPLNSLNLNMQMLEEDLGQARTAGSGGRLLAITRSEISRLERLVSDFLSYARPRPLELEPVAAVDMLQRVAAVLEGRVRQQSVALEVQSVAGQLRVMVDPEQLHQLLLNLVDNAILATAGTGRPAKIVLSAERRGESAVIAVADNGVGMTEEQRRHALEVFYSQRRGGTGLGLAIAARIAKSHNGTLRIESQPKTGTRVELEVPALGLPAPRPERRPAPVVLVQSAVKASKSSSVAN